MIILWILLILLLLLVLVLLLRGLAFRPAKLPMGTPGPVPVDTAGITKRMQSIIRAKTVSYREAEKEDAKAFEAFPGLLRALYPRLHAALVQERIGPRGLLYRWPGKESGAPSVFMSHYDVVPADSARWQKPPFDAVLEAGVLWGRGTLDTKGTLLAILEAAEMLLAEGFVPAHDIYLAFGGDEEIQGGGAPGIVEALARRGVRPAFVLDEGRAVRWWSGYSQASQSPARWSASARRAA